MGTSIEVWRSRIGCFSQPDKSKNCFRVLTLNRKYVSLSVRIALFLLLTMIGGVEKNPGPPRGRGAHKPNSHTRGARGSGSGSKGTYVPENNQPPASAALSQTNRMQTRNQTHQSVQQPTINQWLHNNP